MTEISENTVRAEARAWLEANWNPDYGLVEWRLKLAESGWGVPHWPSRWYGRDLPVGLVPVVEEEFKRIGAIGVAKVGIRTLAAATILAHGTDLQKEKFLLRILTGEDIWCQLFSEPGSGSDVAGAVTRAEIRGNQWVVNGQKVWTTSAHKAHWGLLLARTDWDQPKHRGLSCFILDMKQPGVTVQPLRQMNGYASFNQVMNNQLKNPGLFSCLFQSLPTGGNPRHEGLASLALQNRSPRGIVRIDGDEGLSDLLDQHRIQVAVRGETAVTVARTGPDDPKAPRRQL